MVKLRKKKDKNYKNDWLQWAKLYYNNENIIYYIIFLQTFIKYFVKKKINKFKQLQNNIIGEWRYIHNFYWESFGADYDYHMDYIDGWDIKLYEENGLCNGKALYNRNPYKKYNDFMSCIIEDEKYRYNPFLINYYIKNGKKIYEKENDCFYTYKDKKFYKTIKSKFNQFRFIKNKLEFNYNVWIDKELNCNKIYSFNINKNCDYMLMIEKHHMDRPCTFYHPVLHVHKEKRYSYLLIKILKKNILLDRHLKKLYLSQFNMCEDIIENINKYLIVDEKYYDKNIIKIQKFYKKHCKRYNSDGSEYIAKHWNTYKYF